MTARIMKRITTFTIIWVAAIGSMSCTPASLNGENKTEKSGPPKPDDDERAGSPVMTSGSYLTCEEVPADSNSVEAGCVLHSNRDHSVIDIDRNIKKASWSEDSPDLPGRSVLVSLLPGSGKFHSFIRFTGASKADSIAVAKLTRITLRGIPVGARNDSTQILVIASAVIGDLLNFGTTTDLSGISLPGSPTTPTTTPSQPINFPPTPIQSSQPVAPPVVTTLPTPPPVVVNTPPVNIVTPMADNAPEPTPTMVPLSNNDAKPGVQAQLTTNGGAPQVLLRFDKTDGVSNVSIAQQRVTNQPMGGAVARLSIYLEVNFSLKGKSCSATGFVNNGAENLMVECGGGN